MHHKQLALVSSAMDAIVAECLRSPVATFGAGHLKAIVVEHLLRAGAALFERGQSASEGKLLRLTSDVVRAERHVLAGPPRRRGRPPRTPDVRVLDPAMLALDLYARSSVAAPERHGARLLLERLGALGEGTSDALVLACDRRAYDALRIERAGADEQPTELSRLCAALLPPSASLGQEPAQGEPSVGGRPYGTLAAVTPMVFGAQRVVAAVWAEQLAPAHDDAQLQLDAFAV